MVNLHDAVRINVHNRFRILLLSSSATNVETLISLLKQTIQINIWISQKQAGGDHTNRTEKEKNSERIRTDDSDGGNPSVKQSSSIGDMPLDALTTLWDHACNENDLKIHDRLENLIHATIQIHQEMNDAQTGFKQLKSTSPLINLY